MAEENIVVFDPQAFREIHPQFAGATDAALQNWFDMACLMLDNTPRSPVSDLNERRNLLNLLVCHIAALSKRGDGIVGSLSSASQGKVSTSFAVPTNLNWYKQTTCGYMYYQATQKYRLGGRYYPFHHSH